MKKQTKKDVIIVIIVLLFMAVLITATIFALRLFSEGLNNGEKLLRLEKSNVLSELTE